MNDAEEGRERGASRHQIATLRYVKSYWVRVEHLNAVQMNTLGSLLRRKYLVVQPPDNVILTTAGEQILEDYEHGTWPERTPAPLTERVQNLLRYAYAKRQRK